MIDYRFDKQLHIRTHAPKHLDYPDEIQYNPYEPTPYGALEELGRVYSPPSEGDFVDYGCGKGRVSFFFHHYLAMDVRGIEMEEALIEIALDNQKSYQKHHRQHHGGNELEFICCLAEEYIVTKEDTCFYFFNPFTIHVFRKVISKILTSMETHPRTVDLILYYPHEEYIYYLEQSTSFECVREVPYSALYDKNPDERFLIYRFAF